MQNFGDLSTFSVDFCILYAECPTYFFPVCLTYWPRKYTTRVDPQVDNSHQVWSWYEHPLPLKLRVITFPVGYHWKCVRGHCACAESRDPWVGVQKQLHFWNPRPRFAYSLCNFGGSTMKVIKVICENNARPRVKRHMSFCACAKSRDLLKVPEMSYCSRSRRRRFTALDFKSWTYSRISGHFQQHLYCACAETVIYEIPV